MVLKTPEKQAIWMIGLAIFLLIPVVFLGLDVWKNTSVDPVETAYIDADCDLHKGSCEAIFKGDRKLIYSIKPRPIKPLLSLELYVELVNLGAQSVEVDFQGIGIEMGFYRPELSSRGNNIYTGSASLSVCTLDKMLWQSTVIIKTDKGTIVAPFRFEVDQP